ncbi:CLUMA_CG015915, isoform A [Clunio marinus]|uniref:CLUMA_CG015915, isoform A n=1 Tax=Clunio marinus TaxID=568069 RepID=A0A1J1IVQ6_9DIPT|nr:CLUMA_CG015915, isoform A [Clunio marinus]
MELSLHGSQPMTSKYWTNGHKTTNNKVMSHEPKKEALIEVDATTSCGSESIEEEIVTIKANDVENKNNDVNTHETLTNFTNSVIKQRPDSLKLSFDYGSNSSKLGKSATSTFSVNQSKIMAVAANNHDSKKSTSYDLWVNENVGTKERNESVVGGENRKLDLPGRVSFSTNDVYEIDYSDYDDQETESSQASGNLEKLNKSSGSIQEKMEPLSEMVNNMNGKQYIKEHYMSNSDNELDEIDYRYHSKANDKPLKINQIIEDYKNEVGSINHHRHQQAMVETNQLNNSKGKTSASMMGSKLNQSTNPVIKNYLKAKEDVGMLSSSCNNNHNNRISINTSNKKLNDLSKKSKNLKDLTKPKMSNSLGCSTVKTLPTKHVQHDVSPQNVKDKIKKAKSSSSSSYTRQDSNLDEFQIEKVVSWMSVNEESFSEYELNMADNGSDNKSPMTKETKGNEHDSTYQEIVDIIKEIEHDRKDCEDFKSLKTDVEFKLNTILNSIESPDDDVSPSNECSEGDRTNNKLKEIFSYLDKVDSTCDKALIDAKGNNLIERDNLELEFALEPDVIEDVPKLVADNSYYELFSFFLIAIIFFFVAIFRLFISDWNVDEIVDVRENFIPFVCYSTLNGTNERKMF